MRVAILVLCAVWLTGNCYAEVDMGAIAQIESSNNPNAVSFRGAKYGRGLYQISEVCLKHYNTSNKADIRPVELFNPSINGKVANWYFEWLRGLNLSDYEAIIAYNWGIGNFWKYKRGEKSLPKETLNYLTKYQCLTAGDCKGGR